MILKHQETRKPDLQTSSYPVCIVIGMETIFHQFLNCFRNILVINKPFDVAIGTSNFLSSFSPAFLRFFSFCFVSLEFIFCSFSFFHFFGLIFFRFCFFNSNTNSKRLFRFNNQFGKWKKRKKNSFCSHARLRNLRFYKRAERSKPKKEEQKTKKGNEKNKKKEKRTERKKKKEKEKRQLGYKKKKERKRKKGKKTRNKEKTDKEKTANQRNKITLLPQRETTQHFCFLFWTHFTKGTLCLAFTKKAASLFSKCFSDRRTSKHYISIVHGHVDLSQCVQLENIQKESKWGEIEG